MNTLCARIALAAVSGLILSCIMSPAMAQNKVLDRSPACQAEREVIVNLRPPFFGTPSVWDGMFSNPDGTPGGMMDFSAILPLPDGTVLAAGQKLDAEGTPTHTTLMQVNSRARVLAHREAAVKTGDRFTSLIPMGGGFMASASIVEGARKDQKQTRIIWYDKDYTARKDIVLKDSSYDYLSLGLIPAATGKGVLVLVHAIQRKNPADQYGMIFRIDDQGKTLWKRSYRPGVPNMIYGVTPTMDGQYLATGSIRNEDGRMAGWALLLGQDGTILWQRSYPRGSNAILRLGATKTYLDEGSRFILTGQIMPTDNNPGAAWVMETDNTGAPVWQRYLRAAGYDLDGRSLAVYEDGRSTIVANARAGTPGHSDHIRLFTLSPRGQVMEDESYMEGVAARATSFHLSPDMERVVGASIQVSDRAEKQARKVELITDAMIRREQEEAARKQDGATLEVNTLSDDEVQAIEETLSDSLRPQGWVFAGTALKPFDDPCVVTVADPAQ